MVIKKDKFNIFGSQPTLPLFLVIILTPPIVAVLVIVIVAILFIYDIPFSTQFMLTCKALDGQQFTYGNIRKLRGITWIF